MDRMDVFKFSREINGIHHRFPRWELAVSVTRTVFKVFFLYRKIMPCAIREDIHRRKYQNHHLMIYGTVKPIRGIMVFLPFSSALLQNSKPDRVLLWTGLRRAKSERKTPLSKSTLVGDSNSPHRKLISRNYGGIFI